MGSSTISLGLGLGGGKAATSSGKLSGGSAFSNGFAISLDGTDDCMNVASTSDFAFGSSGFSISFWFNGSDSNTSGFGVNIFDMRSSNTGSQPSLWLETKGANSLVKYYASGAYRVSATATLNIGSWNHLVITNDGSTSKIYLNGNATPIGTGSDPTSYVSAPLKVGGFFGNNYYFYGLIDEFAIFSSELSTSNIEAIYNGGNGPNDLTSLNPLGWWRMGDNDGGTGTTITDQGVTYDPSANGGLGGYVASGNNGTLDGPTFSTNVP